MIKKLQSILEKVIKWAKITATVVVVIFIILAVIWVARWISNRHSQIDISDLKYEGEIAVELNNNRPTFTKEEMKKAADSYENYSKLDSLGRCGVAEASVSLETMPISGEKRTSLGSVNPSGWQSIQFWVRCHLIGWQLTAENDNEKNLITGTNRMNMTGMLPYENEVANYIEEHPGNHVMYRVDPIFEGTNLVASGVNMQAKSVEDNGKGVSFNVYVFNLQPGSIINYKTGEAEDDPEHQTYITLNDTSHSYTGKPVETDAATVIGSTGAVKYIYYTDTKAKVKTTEATGAQSSGGPPVYRGEYYVRAVVSGDEWYPNAASNVAKLVIE